MNTNSKKSLQAVLLLSWATYVTAYLCRINLSSVLDKLASGLDVSVEYLGAASSMYFVAYAIGQLLNGSISDRVNPHHFLMLALTMTGTINLILGLQSNGTVFLLLWCLNGFCQSMFWSTLLRLLSFYTGEKQRKNVSTIMSTCSVTGYLLSWVVLGWLFRPFRFSPYFCVPGVIALTLMTIWYIMARRMPIDGVVNERKSTPPLRQVIREFREDRLFFVCLLCLLVGAIQEGAVFWLPMIFTSVLNLRSGSILLLMMVPFAKLAGVFLARWTLSLFHDNVRTAMIAMTSLACLISGALALTGRHTSYQTVLLIAALIAVVNAGNWYMISYLPLFFSARNIVATLVGAFDFSTYIGASLMSGALGVLLLRFGWIALPALWLLLAILSLLLALTGTGECLRRKGARKTV